MCVRERGGGGPTAFGHMPMHNRDADQRLKSFELAHDECSVGPGTGQTDEEVVAALFGGELRIGFAGDGIAEGRLSWSGRIR